MLRCCGLGTPQGGRRGVRGAPGGGRHAQRGNPAFVCCCFVPIPPVIERESHARNRHPLSPHVSLGGGARPQHRNIVVLIYQLRYFKPQHGLACCGLKIRKMKSGTAMLHVAVWDSPLSRDMSQCP